MKLPKPDDFESPPPGLAPAVCIGLIDLGTQKTEFKGQAKTNRQIRILFELLDGSRKDGSPFTISRKYTFSMSERSNLRADLESWRTKPFTPEEFETFDMRNLIGITCTLNIKQADKNGRTSTFIDGVMARLKGAAPKVKPRAETVYFSLDEFDATTFAKLHDKTQELIKLSPEYHEAVGDRVPDQHDDGGDDFGNNNSVASGSRYAGQIDDEVPF